MAAQATKTSLWNDQIFTLDLVFSGQECDNLVEAAEKKGFRNSSPSGGGHGRTGREDPRTSQFCVFDDPILADGLWQRLQTHVPPDVSHLSTSAYISDGTKNFTKPVAINPHFRVYKYQPKQAFPEHLDYKMRRIVWRGGHKYEQMTYMTLLLYLNHNFQEGQTGFWTQHEIMGKKEHCRFLRDFETKPHQVVVHPIKGRALVSDQNLLHEGVPPSKGTKYVLRSDIVYEREIVLHPRVLATLSPSEVEDHTGEWERIFETSCKNYAD